MKHILYKILLVTLLFSSISADISQSQVDEYMKVSRTGAFLQYLQDAMFYQIVRIYKLDLNNTSNEVLDLIKNKLNSQAYVGQYTEKFKLLDSSQYNKMMSFYYTPTGKKYAKVIEKDFKLDKNSSRATLSASFKKFLLKNPFTEEKKMLIRKITQNLNVVAIFIKTMEELNIYKKYTLPLKYNIDSIKSIEVIKKEIKKNYALNREHEEETNMIYFKDFSEEELKEILDYTATDIAKLEYRLMMEARNSYYKEVMSDIMKDLYE
ncbi:MAG: hypothetical protein L3J43_11445 [Sulfurovum sp.]|nr:hypothetical protein [Sulfurovum sp.]